jgi:hypothetical protein
MGAFASLLSLHIDRFVLIGVGLIGVGVFVAIDLRIQPNS